MSPRQSDEGSALIAEARRLSQPSLVLREDPSDDPPIALWGGTPAVPSDAPNARHWISIDCTWLHRHGYGVQGALSIYVGKGADQDEVAQSEKGRLDFARMSGGVLYGKEEDSVPPLAALCIYGGQIVEKWLRGLKRSRADYNDPVVFQSPAAEEYARWFQARFPLYRPDTAAVLGGWHAPWPDEPKYDERERSKLLLWTLRDAEPWIEVWKQAEDGFDVVRRRT